MLLQNIFYSEISLIAAYLKNTSNRNKKFNLSEPRTKYFHGIDTVLIRSLWRVYQCLSRKCIAKAYIVSVHRTFSTSNFIVLLLKWILLLINILFQNTHNKIMIKKKLFPEFGNKFHSASKRSPAYHHSTCLTSEIIWKPLHFDDPWNIYVIMYSYNISIWCPDRNLCTTTEYPVNYCLIFNFIVITIIFRYAALSVVPIIIYIVFD